MKEPKYLPGQILKMPLENLVTRQRYTTPVIDFCILIEIVAFDEAGENYIVNILKTLNGQVREKKKVEEVPREFLEERCSVDVIKTMKNIKDENVL